MAGSRVFVRFVLAAVLTGCVFILGVGAGTANAATGPFPGEETRFVNLVNAERAAAGLPALAVDPELTSIARGWAASMADNNLLAHNSNLISQITADWSRVGENVGYGHDVDYVMALFVRSSQHYPNIVESRYTHIGVGVVHDRLGRIWTTHEFMGVRTASSGPATPAPAPKPRPAPTTAPPATTPPPPPTTSAPATVAPTTAAPAPPELAASYPSGYQNDVLPEVHEVALAGRVVSPLTDEHGHADALAMVFFAIAAGSLAAALMLRLRGGA